MTPREKRRTTTSRVALAPKSKGPRPERAGGRSLDVRLFGQVEVKVDGEPFRLANPRKSLQIFAYLLLHRAAPVSRDYLAFLIWPDEEEGVARTRLRSSLSDLQKVLPQPASDFIVADAETLSLNPGVRLQLDVASFEAASRDRGRLKEATELYRGDLLAELYDEWIFAIRERHRNAYLTCLLDLISELRTSGDFARALETAERLLAEDPWREDVVRRGIAIRYDAGDRAGALREYTTFSARLRAELGVDPMPETVALAERIRRGADVPNLSESTATVLPPMRDEKRLPFVGRDREMERLSEAWSRAKQGRGGVVFVGGEPGIGKSRLVSEMMHAAEATGGRTLFGATGVPESFPHQALIEALRAGLPLVAALDIGPTWFAALASLLPELHEGSVRCPICPRSKRSSSVCAFWKR